MCEDETDIKTEVCKKSIWIHFYVVITKGINQVVNQGHSVFSLLFRVHEDVCSENGITEWDHTKLLQLLSNFLTICSLYSLYKWGKDLA